MNQKLIEGYIDKYKKFNGVVLVAKNEECLGMVAKGYSNQLTEDALTLDSTFIVPGIAKSFTALGIMKLIKEGELHEEDFLKQYLPELDNGQGINLLHLLNHTSGLVDVTKDLLQTEAKNAKQLVQGIGEKKSLFMPGKKSHESQTDSILLAMIIERISGQSYKTFMMEEIIPLFGLKQTYVLDNEDDCIETRPHLHGKIQKAIPYELLLGWSNVVTSLDDLFKLAYCLENETFFSRYDLENMERVIGKNTFASGFAVDELWKEKCVYQEGELPYGYSAYWARFKTSGYQIIVLSNQAGEGSLKAMALKLLEKVRGEKLPPFATFLRT